MSHAEICPVCGGRGKIEVKSSTTIGDHMETCYGCGGFGWVTVQDKFPDYEIHYDYYNRPPLTLTWSPDTVTIWPEENK